MAIPETPITRQEMYLDAIARNAGGGGSTDNRFVVTLTPTAADYSGTMDKTPAEIDEAWNSGKSIWFKAGNTTAPMTAIDKLSLGNIYVAYIINRDINVLIMIKTSHISNTYSTTRYQLTPMGS